MIARDVRLLLIAVVLTGFSAALVEMPALWIVTPMVVAPNTARSAIKQPNRMSLARLLRWRVAIVSSRVEEGRFIRSRLHHLLGQIEREHRRALRWGRNVSHDRRCRGRCRSRV